MWVTGRHSLGLSEDEFWSLSPGMWYEMNLARLKEIQLADAMQARITMMVASTIPTKSKKKLKEEQFRLFPTERRKRPSSSLLLEKFRGIVKAVNSCVR